MESCVAIMEVVSQKQGFGLNAGRWLTTATPRGLMSDSALQDSSATPLKYLNGIVMRWLHLEHHFQRVDEGEKISCQKEPSGTKSAPITASCGPFEADERVASDWHTEWHNLGTECDR